MYRRVLGPGAHDRLIKEALEREEGLVQYTDMEPPLDACFSHCPIENVEERDGDGDPCAGCPGWGHECGAVWRSPESLPVWLPNARDYPCIKGTHFSVAQLLAEIADEGSLEAVCDNFELDVNLARGALEWAAKKISEKRRL